MEKWKKIEDFPKYEASNEGRIRNATTGRILKPQKETKSGHYHVRLYRETITGTEYKQFKVHRLIAEAFVKGRSEENNEVIFKDYDKSNHNASNLEWASRMSINRRLQEQSKINPHTKKRYRYSKPCLVIYDDGSEKYYESRTIAAYDIGININSLNTMIKFGKYSPKYKMRAHAVEKPDESKLTWDQMAERLNQLEQIIEKHVNKNNR